MMARGRRKMGKGGKMAEFEEILAKVIARVPPVIESLTGLRLDQLIERVRAPRPVDGGTVEKDRLPG